MVEPFTHDQRPVRVVFGSGVSASIAQEVTRLGVDRVLLIGSSRHAAQIEHDLGSRVVVDTELNPRPHVPVEQAEAVRRRASAHAINGCVAVGGGSAIGLAKAVALTHRVPVLAIPTTLSGSEMTRVWGLTTDGVKTTGKDVAVAPRTVLYDPDLLASLPRDIALPSAVNALAHACEALWAPDRTPITDLYATEAARALGRALNDFADDRGGDLTDALYGAWLSGLCLDSTSMSLHHKLCHVLGGTFGLPHAQTHTVVLPYVLAFNAAHAPSALETLSAALELTEPAVGLRSLIGRANGPVSLKELGLQANDLDRVVELALASPYANPRVVTEPALRRLLEAALVGDPPMIE